MILTKQKTEKCVSMFKISDFPADLAWALKVHLMEYAARVSVPLLDRQLASQLGHRMISLCNRTGFLMGRDGSETMILSQGEFAFGKKFVMEQMKDAADSQKFNLLARFICAKEQRFAL